MEIKKCLICWNEYISKTYYQKVCWKDCRRILSNRLSVERNKTKEWKAKRKLWAQNDYIKNKEKILYRVNNWKPYKHICLECWIEFNDWRKNSKFCNNICQYKNSKITRLWENNPSFRNWFYTKISKKSNKHIIWTKEFIKTCKILCKKLINQKWYLYCEECGTTNSLKFENHHLIYRSEKPKHEYLHDIRNILYLCIQCHNEFHKHKSKRNKIVEERKLNELFWDDVLNK